MAVIVALLAWAFSTISADVSELKTDVRTIVKEAAEARVELVRGIGAVERQSALTNQKLDTTNQRLDNVITELRRRP